MMQSAIILESCADCPFSNYDKRGGMGISSVLVPCCFHPASPHDLGDTGAHIPRTVISDGCPISYEEDGVRFIIHPAAIGVTK